MAAAAVSHFCACIGSPCLRQCVHGASIGGGGGVSGPVCWMATLFHEEEAVRIAGIEPARLQELHRRDIAAQQLEDRVRAGGAVAPGDDLCECGWSHMDLAGRDLSGCDLSGRNLSGANLEGANLAGANLAGVDLSGCNLDGAILRGANLDGTRVEGARLGGVQGLAADEMLAMSKQCTGTLATGWDLSEQDLSWKDLSSANLSGCNLSDANLANCNLSGANLSDCQVTRKNLEGASSLEGVMVTTEEVLRAALARGGTVVVCAGATIELGETLEIKTDCAIVGEPGGAAPPVLRRKGGGGLIWSGEGKALELRGLRLEGGRGENDMAVWGSGGRLAVRECAVTGATGVWVDGGCQAELHGVTIHGCTDCGVFARGNATVCTLRGCTLRKNGTDCEEMFGGKIVREEG
eukprot:COSAG01_NODE_3513_length_5984_cov_63.855905_4_plen_408_part_00